ncbi:MAG: hypothetical protein D6816_06300, partial [Bacteroidetes bacterium]
MRVLYTFCILSFFSLLASGQTTQTEFGKNRVQFNQDFADWSQYESPNFITYWYGEGRLIGQSVVQLAEYDFQEIQGIVDYRMNDKIEIIVYKDLTDLKQSNIGSEEAFVNTGGQTKIVGNKMFVYFNGDHNHLRKQIRSGIASVYLNAMLFGSNLQEIVQNAVMMNLPAWFRDGLVAFVGEEWNSDLDNDLRNLLLSGQYENFDDLAEDHPQLAGHSLWYFIASHYGTPTVSNLIYLTRIHRSVDSGFLFVLGSTYERTTQAWEDFFIKRYTAEKQLTTSPDSANLRELKIKNKRNVPLTALKLSPDGTKVAYVLNEIGRIRVYVHDLATDDRTLVYKGGFRNAIQATDYNYPLIAWNPNNMELAVLYEKRDVPKLLLYNVLTKEKTEDELINQFQRVYSMDFINPNELVFSAAVRGQSDIFRYFIKTRQSQRLTTDFWDDLDASFVQVHGQRGILFASNRPDSLNVISVLDSILPVGDYDIFYLNLDSIGSPELVQVTNTPLADERMPIAVDTTWFAFVSNESGISNRKVGYLENYLHHFDNLIFFDDGNQMRLHSDSMITEKLDSVALSHIDSIKLVPVIKQRAVTHFTTNYDRNIVLHHKASRNDRFVQLFYDGNKPRIYYGSALSTSPVVPVLTTFRQQKLIVKKQPAFDPASNKPQQVMKEVDKEPVDVETLPQEKQDTGKVDIDNYLFQSEFDDTEVPTKGKEEKQPEVV